MRDPGRKQVERHRLAPADGGGPRNTNCGSFVIPRNGLRFCVLVSDTDGWDHVSVTILNEERCPTWEEMCWVKGLFFKPNECVVQFHPSQDDYVNCHPYCLHLWKPQGREIVTPQGL